MKASQAFGRLAVALLSVSTAASAWTDFLPQFEGLILRREDTTTTTSASTSEAASSSAADTFNLNTGSVSSTSTGSSTGSSTSTGTGKTTSTSKKATTTASGSATGTASASGSSGNSTHTSYDDEDPAGSIVMLTPTTSSSVTQLYRIGDYVTWVWNYTSLQGTPTALDVLAKCTSVSSTYTLTQNMTFETIGSYTWDTAAYQSAHPNIQLLTQQYTLVIYDADSSVSATAEPGYLTTFDDFTFGLYAGQNYTSIADGWTCNICSAGVSDNEKRVLGFAVSMSIITVLSFTWFVTGMRLV